MGLNVGNLPVKQVYVGSTPVTAVYVGAEKIWPTIRETVQITLGTGTQARDQLRAALAERELNYSTVTEVPFEIELIGSGSTQYMFQNCSSLAHAPAMDTSQVTDMNNMFYGCSALTTAPTLDTAQVTNMRFMFAFCASLTHVPDMDTSQVTDMNTMFRACSSLTDGNVRLIGRHPNVSTTNMFVYSGLTREPFYTTDGQPWPTAEVHEVSLTDVVGSSTLHPLLTVTVPAGETWTVTVQGTISTPITRTDRQPRIVIGSASFGPYRDGAVVSVTGTVTSASRDIGMLTNARGTISVWGASFTGTVTIEK